MEEKVYCPICGKRIFDLRLKGSATVNTKCRHCNRIVTIEKEVPLNARGDPVCTRCIDRIRK